MTQVADDLHANHVAEVVMASNLASSVSDRVGSILTSVDWQIPDNLPVCGSGPPETNSGWLGWKLMECVNALRLPLPGHLFYCTLILCMSSQHSYWC